MKNKIKFLLLFFTLLAILSFSQNLSKLIKDKKITSREKIKLLKRYIVRNPKDRWGYFYLAHLDKMEKISIEKRIKEKEIFKRSKGSLSFYIGIRYFFERKYKLSLEYLEKSILENPKEQITFEIYLDIINEFNFKERALNFFKSFKEKNCSILSSISEIYLYLNDYENFRKYLSLAKKCKAKEKNISIFLLECQDLAFKNKFKEAIEKIKNELEFYEKKKDYNNLAYLHLLLGTFYHLKYKYTLSHVEFQKSLNYCEKTLNIFLKNSILSSLANYYINIGYYLNAEKVLKKLLKNIQLSGGMVSQIEAYMKLAFLYENLGNYDKAYSYYYKALNLSIQLRDKLYYLVILSHLGDIELNVGNYLEAKKYYELAMKHKQIIKLFQLEPSFYASLGEIYEGLGDKKKAEKYYKMGVEFSKKNKNLEGLAYLYFDLSIFYGKEKSRESIKYALKAYELYKKMELPDNQKRAILSISFALYLNKKYKKSIKWLLKLYGISVETCDYINAFISSGFLGKCYKKLGDFSKALFYFKKANFYIEKISNSMETNLNLKLNFESSIHKIYEEYIDTYFNLFLNSKKAYYIDESFKIVERYKSQNLFYSFLKNRFLEKLKNVSPEIKLKLYILNKKIAFLRNKFITAKTINERSVIKNHLENLLHERENLLKKLRLHFFKKFAEKNLISTSEIQNIIGNENACIEFFIGENKSFYWIITKNKLIFKKFSLTQDRLNDILKKISYNLYCKNNFKNGSLMDETFAGFNIIYLNQLFTKYFKEIFDEIPSQKKLIISPDSSLLIFPMEALVTTYDSQKVDFLISKFSMIYIPNFSFIKLNILNSGGRRFFKKDILTMGISNFSKVSKNLKRYELKNLPYSSEEAFEIANMFKNSKYLINNDATEHNFKKIFKNFSIIHLSTHTIIEENTPIYSKIILNPDKKWNEDGIVYGYELSEMNFNTNLMVLNGCETGKGKIFNGSGLYGISKILLSSGIKSLIVTLWPVKDYFAKNFMLKFYTQLKKVKNTERALRETKLFFIKNLKYRDPYYWASYILIGKNTIFQNLEKEKDINKNSLWKVIFILLLIPGVISLLKIN